MKRKQHRYSLQLNLVLVICLLIIPINILLIYISGLTVKNIEQRLVESHENELNILDTRIENIAKTIDDDMKTGLIERWAVLDDANDRETLQQQKLISNLRILWQKIDLVEAGYLKLNQSDYVNVTYNNEIMNLQQKDELTDGLKDIQLNGRNSNNRTMKTESGDWYWIWNMNCNGYSYGLIIPFTQILKMVQESVSSGSEIFLVSNKKILLSSIGAAGKINSYEKDRFKFSLDLGNLEIVKLVPSKVIHLRIPLWQRVLQSVPFIALIIIPILWLAIRKLVIIPMNRLNVAMNELEKDNPDYRMDESAKTSREFQYINHTFNRMASQISELRIQKYETEIEKLKIETDNLRLQVNPHLLLNSLNVIYNLAKLKDFRTIQSFSLSLADYFRYAIRYNEDFVTLGSEMKFVKSYLDIQKVRFPGAFTSVYEMDDELEGLLMPPLLIQNFVENSIKYALKLGSTVEIIIVIRKDGETHVSISIIDTGNGIPADVLKQLQNGEIIQNKTGKHIGIWNIRRRLKSAYGDDFILNINSTEKEGTQIWIRIPLMKKGEDEDESNDR